MKKISICVELGHTDLPLLVKPNHLSATEENHRCNRFQYGGDNFSFAFCIFVPDPLNDTCPLPASHFLYCSSLWLKDQTYFDSHSRRSLLGNWCQRGREGTSKLITQREREKAHPSLSPDAYYPKSWEEVTCLQEGKYMLVCIMIVLLCFPGLLVCSDLLLS